jgi:hypothetical protein
MTKEELANIATGIIKAFAELNTIEAIASCASLIATEIVFAIEEREPMLFAEDAKE